MVAFFVKTAALAVTLLTATTEAHNKMILPLPTWPAGVYNQNSPSGTIDPTKVLPVPSGMSYNTDPTSNTKAYWTAFNASKYKSLKELAWDSQTLASGASKECGFSIVDGTPRDLPAEVQWDFFTSSHQGPCEVWCDGTLVFEDSNCAADYTKTPASLPYDKAKCKGKKVLTSYWIALHTTPWQVYTNCAPLKGGSSSSSTTTSSSSGTSPTTTTAPSTSSSSGTSQTTTIAPSTTTKKTSAPATTTDAPTTTSSGSNVGGGASASTDAPATTPTTSSPSTDKCSVRRRRRD